MSASPSRPIVPGFHPDPSICRVGETYYMAHSSFEYAPGIPIHRSHDLITWELVGNVLPRIAPVAFRPGGKQAGIWAVTLRHHADRFWLTTTDVSQPGRGQLIVNAESPEGPWSEPVYVDGALGIDPDLVWDPTGTCHLTWGAISQDLQGVTSVPVDPVTGKMLGRPRPLWAGTGLDSTEAPHLYLVDDWWYLLVAEGGTARGHTVAVARARSLDGPFEPAPHNPLLTHRSTAHPVQNVGHADLVRTPDGSWAAVYLGVRSRGVTPGFHVNGRETFLAGVDWVDGWPVVDEHRFRVPVVDRSFEDRFTEQHLHPRWIAPAQGPHTFTRPVPGGLELAADAERTAPPMLLTRTLDEEWTAEVDLDVSRGAARVLVRMDDAHWYGVTVAPEGAEAILAIGPAVAPAGRHRVPRPDEVTVRLSARLPTGSESFGPDLVELALVLDDGCVRAFGSFDGRYLSTEVVGGFTGRTWGVEALHGRPVVRRVRYVSTAAEEQR
ncbi:family 43 glycosylhydrolase [Streptomyces sp. NPDC059894]|uniref:glycoside hydrolase family 43 protein n=1 Tax=unclassified Streptomyces TaxID=2593676 RepID=UPI00364E1661